MAKKLKVHFSYLEGSHTVQVSDELDYNDGAVLYVLDADGKIVFEADEAGDIALPTIWVVCERCRGEGEVALPGVSFSSSDLEELGQDFCDDYAAGHYNDRCPDCRGRTTVMEIDHDRCPALLVEAHERQQRQIWSDLEVERQERAWGA